MSPQNPINPDSLSLTPSASTPGTPDFSNVRSSVDTVPAGNSPEFSNVQSHVDTVPGGAAMQTYTVRKGDTLSQIAHHHYGKASRWHAIFEANRDQLDNPDLIQPGQVLRLPADT